MGVMQHMGEDTVFEIPAEDTIRRVPGFEHNQRIRMFTETTSMLYPSLNLSCNELENFRATALKSLMGVHSLLSTSDGSYATYIHTPQGSIHIGYMEPNRLMLLLTSEVLRTFTVSVNLDADTQVEGDLLYALCPLADSLTT